MGFFKLLIFAIILIFAISFFYSMLIFLGIVKVKDEDINLKLLIPFYSLFVKTKKDSNK